MKNEDNQKAVPFYGQNLTKHIITEKVYPDGVESLWGKGNYAMLEFLKNVKFEGKVMDLGAGDGRYTRYLLESNASSVLATDIDPRAPSKLLKNTPEKYQSKLKIQLMNITEVFPFEDESIDNMFSAGTLHLFPPYILRKIFGEIDRVTKPGGRVIIELTTNINRTNLDGTPYRYLEGESSDSLEIYSLEEGKQLLPELFKGYNIDMSDSHFYGVMREQTPNPYLLDCDYLLLDMLKKRT